MTGKKFNVIVEAPVFNRSGYGVVADVVVPMLIRYPKFNTGVLPTNWGNCVQREIAKPDDALVRSRLLAPSPQMAMPDIFISINLPHCTKAVGRIFNINFCAGVEVDRCPDDLIKGANQFDLSIVPSTFTRQVYLNSAVKPNKAIEVLPTGIDTSIYKISDKPNDAINRQMEKIKENEAFLFVGQRANANLAMDRKNIPKLITSFCEAFRGKDKKPALLLKSNGVGYSTFDRNDIIGVIREEMGRAKDSGVAVYLLHGEQTEEEMNALYNHPKVIAHVSCTRGEGQGLPLLEGSLSGKTVIAPNHSGHLDFLDHRALLLPGQLETIPEQSVNPFFIKGSRWFEVDTEATKKVLQDFYYGDRTAINKKALELAKDNAKRFSIPEMEKKLHKLLDKYLC